MIIKRVKILTPFRGLPAGFEIKFNQHRTGLKKKAVVRNIEPLCLVGLNGSGKSNVLELIAEIFYYLEAYHKDNSRSLSHHKTPFGFEIEYILSKTAFDMAGVYWNEISDHWGKDDFDPTVFICKNPSEYPVISAIFPEAQFDLLNANNNRNSALLPSRVVAYSSGLNELLSNPFIKMDFQYFDDLESKKGNKIDLAIDINRLYFLNYESNKFVTICNMLFDAADFAESDFSAEDFGGKVLTPLNNELNIDDVHSFSLQFNLEKLASEKAYLTTELSLALDDLKQCATLVDERTHSTKKTDSLEVNLYFWVNTATKQAFRHYFKAADNLFRYLYFFNLLNHGLISAATRREIASSRAGSYENLSDWIPKLELSKLRFSMRELTFIKSDKSQVNYRKLSDGEHQLLHVFGGMILMDKPGTLFLYDEPETHFNPGWRSKFISLVNQCIRDDRDQEIMLTTHSPFIVSDTLKENVIIFEKRDGTVIIKPSPIKTFGTSVSIITDKIFNKEETLADVALAKIQEIKQMPMDTMEQILAAKEASRILGESPEKVLLFRELILREDELNRNA